LLILVPPEIRDKQLPNSPVNKICSLSPYKKEEVTKNRSEEKTQETEGGKGIMVKTPEGRDEELNHARARSDLKEGEG